MNVALFMGLAAWQRISRLVWLAEGDELNSNVLQFCAQIRCVASLTAGSFRRSAGIYPAIPNNSGSVINTPRITRFPDSIAVTVVVGIWAEPAELAEGDPKSDVTHFCADDRP